MSDAEQPKNAVSALDELYPPPVRVTLGERVVEMHPLPVLDLPKLQKAVPVWLAWLQSNQPNQGDFFAERIADLVPFIAASARESEDTIGRSYGGHVVAMFVGAIEANEDFFRRSAAMVFGMPGAELANKILGPGRAQSAS